VAFRGRWGVLLASVGLFRPQFDARCWRARADLSRMSRVVGGLDLCGVGVVIPHFVACLSVRGIA
jgi:hypothetical protein